MKKLVSLAFYATLTASLLFTACGHEPDPEPEPEKLVLTLTFGAYDITASSAAIEVTPSDTEIPYYWSVMTADKYESFTTPEALKQEDMAYFESLAEESGKSVAEIISQKVSLGAVNETISNLTPETSYVVYGYALKNNNTSDVSKSDFDTEPGGIPQSRVDITINATRMSEIDVTITPESMDVLYYPDQISDDIYQQYGGNTQALVDYFEAKVDYYATGYGITRLEQIESMWKRGIFQETYKYLDAESKFWTYVVELTTDGEVIGVDCKEATTTERRMVDMTFDIQISNLTQTSFDANVIPSDKNQKYYWDLYPKADYARGGGTDEGFMSSLVTRFGSLMERAADTGDAAYQFYGLSISGEYILVAFAFDGTWISDLSMVEVTTVGSIAPEDLEIEIDIDMITSTRSATFFDVEDAYVPIHFHYMTKEFADQYATDQEKVQAGMDAYITMWYNRYPGEFTWEETVLLRRAYGQYRYTYVESVLVPDTDYIMWAGAFDERGRLISKPFMKEFRTEQYVESNATVTPIYNKYFRYLFGVVDPVSQGGPVNNDPDVEDNVVNLYEGVEVANTNQWYISMFRGDYSDPAVHPNYWLASQLYNSQGSLNMCKNGPEVRYLTRNPYDTWTLVAVGIGADGNYGVPYRRKVVITEDGCSPASEFPAGVLNAPAAPASDGLNTVESINFMETIAADAPQTAANVAPAATYVSRIAAAAGDNLENAPLSELAKSSRARFSYRIR